MTQERSQDANAADAQQSDHERKVAEHEESADRGRSERPTSRDDLAADMTPGHDGDGREDSDVVGDDQSSPGQNSDRLPQ